MVAQGSNEGIKKAMEYKISTRYHKEVGYPGHAHQKTMLESKNTHFSAEGQGGIKHQN